MSEDEQGQSTAPTGRSRRSSRRPGSSWPATRCSRSARRPSVRVRDGETLTTDGPFAETKEVLGGYYLIDVETLDEALEWGAKIPGATYGTIEVRPVVTDYETMSA